MSKYKKLVQSGCVISRAIRSQENNWYVQLDSNTISIDFSTCPKEAVTLTIFLERYAESENVNNTLILHLDSLKSWIKSNRDKVEVNGSVITLNSSDINSFKFLKKRNLVIVDDNWGKNDGMKPIEVDNRFKVKPVFDTKKKVFIDYFYNESEDKYYDLVYEKEKFSRFGYKNAKVPNEYVEVNINF